MKNKNCGDIINLEVIIKNQKFKSMRYETESLLFIVRLQQVFWLIQ